MALQMYDHIDSYDLDRDPPPRVKVGRQDVPHGDLTSRRKLRLRHETHINLIIAAKDRPEDLELPSYEEYCAIAIQAAFRAYRIRKKPLVEWVPGPLASRVRNGTTEELHNLCATVIQKLWRRFVDKEVYRYYRDLIKFNFQGHPARVLRTINPREAKLLDTAAGVYVRFRLGGVDFPPQIYYKIFTRRTVVDICALAPRDYTAHGAQKPLAAEVNNHPIKNTDIKKNSGSEGWYQRWENNGWRPIVDQMAIYHPDDPVMVETANQIKPCKPFSKQRSKEQERIRKQRKREWMMHMYKEGSKADRVNAGTSDTNEEISDEGEEEELLNWSMHLDFESRD